MLVITRRPGEKIVIGDDIEVTVLESGRGRVRFGIEAPKSVKIHTQIKTAEEAEAKREAVRG